MMARTQITLDPETQRRAKKRASELGVSLAEYMRGLVARDLGGLRKTVNPSSVFNLGASGRSRIGKHKDAMLAEAFAARK